MRRASRWSPDLAREMTPPACLDRVGSSAPPPDMVSDREPSRPRRPRLCSTARGLWIAKSDCIKCFRRRACEAHSAPTSTVRRLHRRSVLAQVDVGHCRDVRGRAARRVRPPPRVPPPRVQGAQDNDRPSVGGFLGQGDLEHRQGAPRRPQGGPEPRRADDVRIHRIPRARSEIDPAARFQPDTRVHPAATVPNHPPPNPKPRKNQLS